MGRWVVEVNRHGHNGNSNGWTYMSGARSEDDARSKAERFEAAHSRSKWLPGRAPKVAYEYRARLDHTPLEPLAAFTIPRRR